MAASSATVTYLGGSATGAIRPLTLTGGGASTTTDAAGHFMLSGLPAAQGQLRATISGGASATIQVTVFTNATATVGTPKVSRASALQLAQAAVPSGTETDQLFIMSPQEPVPAGAQISEALGNANGDQDNTTTFTTSSDQWLFYIDPNADMRFQHPVLYFLVDSVTGATTTHQATSYPQINGHTMYADPSTNRSSADLAVAPTVPPAVARPSAPAFVANGLQPKAGTGGTYAILVQGEDESSMAADITNIQTMFGKNGLPPAISTTIIKPTSQSPRADFKAALAAAIKNAGPSDTIFVYVTAHGNSSGSINLGRSKADGTPSDTDDKLLSPDFDFRNAKNPLNCTVILDSCYSATTGVAIAKLNAGSGLIVATATDTIHNSVGVGKWDPRAPTGGVFTTEFVGAFNRLSGYTNYSQAFNVAFNATAITLANYTILLKDVSSMNPQIFFSASYPHSGAAGQHSFGTQWHARI